MGKATASVAVLYASDYGFSDRLSQTLARGITKAGVATDMVDLLSVDPQVRHQFAQVSGQLGLSHLLPSRVATTLVSHVSGVVRGTSGMLQSMLYNEAAADQGRTWGHSGARWQAACGACGCHRQPLRRVACAGWLH